MKVKQTKLLSGVHGTIQTVSAMRELIIKGMRDEKVQRIARDLKSNSKNDIELFELCHKYIVDNIRYEKDTWRGNEHEVVSSAKHTIGGTRPFGDCDDMTVALATLLKLNKIECAIKIVAWKKEFKDQYTHVYLLAYIESLKAWIPADPVRDSTIHQSGFGWEISPVYMRKVIPV